MHVEKSGCRFLRLDTCRSVWAMRPRWRRGDGESISRPFWLGVDRGDRAADFAADRRHEGVGPPDAMMVGLKLLVIPCRWRVHNTIEVRRQPFRNAGPRTGECRCSTSAPRCSWRSTNMSRAPIGAIGAAARMKLWTKGTGSIGCCSVATGRYPEQPRLSCTNEIKLTLDHAALKPLPRLSTTVVPSRQPCLRSRFRAACATYGRWRSGYVRSCLPGSRSRLTPTGCKRAHTWRKSGC